MFVYFIMNNNKRLKPNLLDPLIEKKIIKTLKPQKDDYWEPTKKSFHSFYQNYIKPNMSLVIFVIVIILFLIYRYRVIKKEREIKQTEKIHENMYVIPKGNNVLHYRDQNSEDINEYTKMIMHLYNQQKENMREPDNRNNITNRTNRTNRNSKLNEPKFAYPMYPYAKGGLLAPSGSR